MILLTAREKWLTSTFPRFSAKSRGGRPPAIQPPPHTIKSHGRFDLSVGPHNFTHTAIYEVHYLPSTPQVPPPQASTAAQTHSQATITQPTALTGLAGQTATQPASIDATVTPTLISQVNAAAESNPILSRLLHTAAAGRATPDEIKTLSILIRSLGIGMEPSPPPPPLQESAQPVNAVPPEPVKPFDIVIEFQERPSDRWILPRGLTSFEFIPYTSSVLSRGELVMTFGLPFPVNEQNAEKGPEPPLTPTPEPSRAVTMRWNGVLSSVYELALKWVGGEEISAQNLRTLEDLVSV